MLVREKKAKSAPSLFRQIKTGKAIQSLEETIKKSPDDCATRLKLAEILLRTGKNHAAIPHFQKAGESYAAMDLYRKSIACYKQALTLDENNFISLLGLAKGYLGLKQKWDAKGHFLEALKNSARNGTFKQQKEIFLFGTEQFPEEIALNVNFARLLFQNKEHDLSQEYFCRAIDKYISIGDIFKALVVLSFQIENGYCFKNVTPLVDRLRSLADEYPETLIVNQKLKQKVTRILAGH